MSLHPAPKLLFAATGLCLSLAACGPKAPVGSLPTPQPFAEAILYDGAGNRTGIATLVPDNGQLRGTVEVTRGLTPGEHGLHIHAIGKCTLPDFVSAGAHLNPDGRQHGLADADDMRTDPTGNSGGRVMCGVFYRKLP